VGIVVAQESVATAVAMATLAEAAVPAVPVVLVVLVPAELELKIQSLALVYIMLPVGGRYMCRCKCSFWR
jgi:hypothetical protein